MHLLLRTFCLQSEINTLTSKALHSPPMPVLTHSLSQLALYPIVPWRPLDNKDIPVDMLHNPSLHPLLSSVSDSKQLLTVTLYKSTEGDLISRQKKVNKSTNQSWNWNYLKSYTQEWDISCWNCSFHGSGGALGGETGHFPNPSWTCPWQCSHRGIRLDWRCQYQTLRKGHFQWGYEVETHRDPPHF